MAQGMGHLEVAARLAHRHRGLILPIGAAALIFAVLVPLPPALMDMLLAANIALAAIILLTTIYVASPLEFSVFPSLLLGATLVRLVLNVATTRLILTAGAEGRSMAEAQVAAGRVIWAFSRFVTGNSLAVGVILFAIIAIIQFVVITKGAARISEVAARFVLDAMPGKQMAIDADMNAGLINEGEAHRRRQQIAREADFYGSMDGASKFLRGDAVAAVIITLVNIGGGLYTGMVQYGWSFEQTLGLFTRLTVGDGLVTQVPAFIVSISAALIVTRSTVRTNLGEEVISQLTRRPVALAITAGFLAALMLTSLPKIPLLLLGVGCAGLALILSGRTSADAPGRREDARSAGPNDRQEATEESPLGVDPLRIEMGFALVGLIDSAEGGGLLDRISALRKQVACELGLPVPHVKICDNMSLDPKAYVVKIRGVKVAAGQLHPTKLLALGGERAEGPIAGLRAAEPAFGAPAVWISRSQRERAETLNYTIVEPTAALVTHLGEIIRTHAAELLSRQQVRKLLDNLKTAAAAVVDEAADRFTTGQIQHVLQNLLRERVPIRDLEVILETMCDEGSSVTDAGALTERVRDSLRRVLTQQYCDDDGKLWCVSLAASLEEELAGSYLPTDGGGAPASPKRARQVAQAVADGIARLTSQGRRPVLVCDPQVRPALRRMIAPVMPEVTVLGYNEVETAEVQSVGSVGIE